MPRLLTALASTPPITLPDMWNIMLLRNTFFLLSYTLYSASQRQIHLGSRDENKFGTRDLLFHHGLLHGLAGSTSPSFVTYFSAMPFGAVVLYPFDKHG